MVGRVMLCGVGSMFLVDYSLVQLFVRGYSVNEVTPGEKDFAGTLAIEIYLSTHTYISMQIEG